MSIIKSLKNITQHFFLFWLILGYRHFPLKYQTKEKIRFYFFQKFPNLKKQKSHSINSLLCSYIKSVWIKYAPLFFNLFNPSDFLNKFNLYLIHEAKHIDLKSSVKPLVSIIIPIYGQIGFTICCLKSIGLNLPKCTFEIILIDDASRDNSLAILKFVKGIKVFKNTTNKGFIYSCNFGAKKAKGEYLYFLNNDTQVTSGWLDHLVQTFKDFPGTGLVGSKLVYPNGRLQEAGGIIWRDGSAWNFGRRQDPNEPIFSYAREVDYCSGASIMIPKIIFNKMKGFDPYYSPAYCEDSDLALKLRERGYRVIYQPLSTVIHFEGMTSGKDTSSGVKSYQVVNLHKQYKRWKHRLSTYQENGENVDSAKDRRASRRVLYLDSTTPSPDKDSGSIDAFNHMLLLREMNFQVTFIPTKTIDYMNPYTLNLQRNGIEALYYPYIKSVEEHLKNMGDRYDLVIFSRVETAQRLMSTVKDFCKKAKTLFITVDLHFLRLERTAILEKSKNVGIMAEEIKKQELDIMKWMDITTVISTYEYDLLLKVKAIPKAKLRLLPYTRQINKKVIAFENRKNIVFVGNFRHPPNIDAVKFFVSEIMPHIRKLIPDLKFYIVGSQMTKEIKALRASDIVIQGFVQDLSSFLSTFKLSVAPLRLGAGIKGKIGTSLSLGLPVISTSIGTEGMGLKNKENVIIEDKTKAFAEKLVSTYKDKRLWDKLSKNGLVFAEKNWGANKGFDNLSSILNDLDFSIETKSYPLKLYSD